MAIAGQQNRLTVELTVRIEAELRLSRSLLRLLPSLTVKVAAAQRYFEKSIAQNGEPETVTIDKSGANLAALEAINAERETPIRIRQTKCLNNIIDQDHSAIKRRTRPMLGFKNFRCARILPGGIEVARMIARGR